jgi:ATP-dependent Lon protease
MTETTTRTLPILPLPSGVVLPGMVVTIGLESEDARAAVDAAGPDRTLVLVPKVNDRFAKVGVLAHVEDEGTLPDGTAAIVIRAEQRVALGLGTIGTGTATWVQVDSIEEPAPTERTEELASTYRATARTLLERLGGRRLTGLLRDVETPGALADTAGWWPDLSVERKVELLETIDVDRRLEKVTAWTKEALAEYEVADKIRHDVTDGMEKQQREFLLRQQLAAIRKELGDGEDEDDVVEQFRAKVAERSIPDGPRKAIEREIDRLERTSPQNQEHGWIRAWLDTVIEIPFGERTDDDFSLAHARAVLDADHTGLEEVKDRIVEDLAVRKLRADRATPDLDADPVLHTAEEATADAALERETRPAPTILVLAGPPGVGKTSLGASIARALGRRFVRVALGGVRDEADIRGHRRTYVGAKEGRIARALIDAGTMNPVFLLDEIDKVGSDWRGDPSAALLEVLDPAQNHTFRDHYLEIELDLSDVLFIATANQLDTIPGPLLDRMEIITIDGYTEAEKVAIARDHLVPRLVKRTGLRIDEVTVTEDAVAAVIADHTREAGVRGLERQLGKVLRKAATSIAVDADNDADDAEQDPGPRIVDVAEVTEALGRPRFRRDEANREPTVGVVNGLAVTGAGGDVLIVEATAMDGEGPERGSLVLTGQLGDVMNESGQIALSFIRSQRDAFGIDAAAFGRRFHVHFPAGAVPKDGPSAGVTMSTALVSLLTGRAVKPSVGMTGEVTLQGNVLPIGGVKQKLLAAHRAGLTDVVIPKANEPDLDDLPEAVRTELRIHPVAHVREVIAIALEDAPSETAAAA